MAPDLSKVYCSLDKVGASVLRSLPTGEPTLLRRHPSDWDKLDEFRATLDKASKYASWPASASAACSAFLAAPPCVLRGVAWDLQRLRSPAAAPPPPAFRGDPSLAVCPLITSTRTKAGYAADVAAVCGSRDPARFNTPYSALEVGDFAFVLPSAGARNGFTLHVSGRQSSLVELLEIVALLPGRKARTDSLGCLLLTR